MALLNSDGKYIKILDTEGNFEVYETAKSREVNKAASNPEDILAKYDELILEAQNSYEKYIQSISDIDYTSNYFSFIHKFHLLS